MVNVHCHVTMNLLYHHYRFSFDPVSSPSTELAGFRMVIDFTTSLDCTQCTHLPLLVHFLLISFFTCFFFFRKRCETNYINTSYERAFTVDVSKFS